MSIGSIKHTLGVYSDLVGLFFTEALVGAGTLEEYANDGLQPLRLWLTGAKSRTVRFFPTGYANGEDIPNALIRFTIHLFNFGVFCGAAYIAIFPLTSAVVGISVSLMQGYVSGIAAGLCAAINHIVEGIFVLLFFTVILPIAILTLSTLGGVILKIVSWRSDPKMIDKYRQYLLLERMGYESALVTHYRGECWEKEGIYGKHTYGIQDKIILVHHTEERGIHHLPYLLFQSIVQNLDDKAINSLRLVCHRFAYWLPQRHNWCTMRQEALIKLQNIFGAKCIEKIGIESLMAYPSLCIPYHSFRRQYQDVTLFQRFGSKEYLQSIKLIPEDLGGHKVRWGIKPLPFIAILKANKYKQPSWTTASTCVNNQPVHDKYKVKLIFPH